ncbi:MAG: hypothetical protein J5537_09090 [Lachnospiraceae bacterium]|nr:hypothetical protein [Lachnospiraceae bacterium]MBR5897327.1 hypothetical protein [Lachnospiraceae bacterium]
MNKTEMFLKKALSEATPKEGPRKQEQAALKIRSLPINDERINYPLMIIRILRFVSWKIWLVQGMCFIFLAGILIGISNQKTGPGGLMDPRLICIFCGSLPFISIPFIYRSAKYKMSEVEMGTFFSYSRQILARLIVIAFGNVCMIIGSTVICLTRLYADIMTTIAFGMIPFLFINTIILLILSHVPRHASMWLYGLTYLVLITISAAASDLQKMVENYETAPYVIVLCIVLCLIITLQLKGIIREGSIVSGINNKECY